MRLLSKRVVLLSALALVVLAQVVSAEVRSAADKAIGYYGTAASPEPADATYWNRSNLNMQSTYTTAAPTTRRFSYAPAPQTAKAPAAQAAPATPATRAPAVTTPAPVRRYSYSAQPRSMYRGNYQGDILFRDRVLGRQPESRDAAAKAIGEY